MTFLTRRHVLAGAAVLATPAIARAADQQIVFASGGGSWQAAMTAS